MCRGRSFKAWLFTSIFLLGMGFTTAAGRTIYVDDDGLADFNTIQEAIDDSNDGDTIIVRPGLYLEFVRFHGKNITLISTEPTNFNVVARTIIDYGVGFVGSEEPNCTLTGFKINGRIWGVDYAIDPTGENHTHATISYCLLVDCYRVSDGMVIEACDGVISNCVIVDNWPTGDLIRYAISGCHGLIKNCTVTNNIRGISVLEGGTTTIENCIIYVNGIKVDGGANVNVLYSDVDIIYGGGTVNWGPGNMDADPCFIDAANGDYHLKSQAGRWDPNSQSWVQDDNTSPCIDAGNQMSPIGNEPFPNGGRINMGAYGGSVEASKSYFGEPVCEIIVAGDVNGDCMINFLDFQLIALNWLRDENQ